jgi:prolyl-tRNA editing enzyme YbaK/EbsC (Cys-tRNA(Pro) deacylase)
LRTIVVRRGEDDYLFVLVPAGRRFDWPKLRAHLGVSRLSLPDADEARDVTGYERYTITPFGSSRAWPVIADSSIGEVGQSRHRWRAARRECSPEAGRPFLRHQR